MIKRVMVIDDEESIRSSLDDGLSDLGYQVRTVEALSVAKKAILEFRPQVILLDLRLKDGDGLRFIDTIKAIDEEIQTIIITAYGDIQSAVQAMKTGAFEYITKPFDLDEIELQVERAFGHYVMNRNVHLFQEANAKSQAKIITQSGEMIQILENVRRVAQLDDVTVLITGETGTGKELIADFLYSASKLQDVPMVKVNCATIPKELFESELYGHEKSAFTGAEKLKKGLLEMADGGIVFLDEVGEIPLEQQAKLLRFLEDKKIKRVGGTEAIDVRVRVIAATNRDLLSMVQKGLYRADFYYRLNVVPVKLPPLRARKEDIMLLAGHFMHAYNLKFGSQLEGFTQKAKDHMEHYSWPGNIRELRNLIERLCIIHGGGVVDLCDLPVLQGEDTASLDKFDYLRQLDRGQALDLPAMIDEIEQECIERAMEICGGNQSKAAELLNMSRFAIKRRMDSNS